MQTENWSACYVYVCEHNYILDYTSKSLSSIVKHKHRTMYAKWKTFPLTVSCLRIKFRLKGKLNYVFVYKR